jgi:hypothetical protein
MTDFVILISLSNRKIDERRNKENWLQKMKKQRRNEYVEFKARHGYLQPHPL